MIVEFNPIKNNIGDVLCLRKTVLKSFSQIFIFLVAVLLITSCGESVSERVDETGGLTARQIVENLNAYIGKPITVSGRVGEIHEPRAFTMDTGTDTGLLVVGREPYPEINESGDRAYLVSNIATVTGITRNMNAAEVEHEIGWDVPGEIESKFNGKPVMIAQKVSFRPPSEGGHSSNTNSNQSSSNTGNTSNTNTSISNESNTGNTNQQNSNANTTGQQTSGNLVTDPEAFASARDRNSLVGRDAEFSNVRVIRILDPRAFTVQTRINQINPADNGELYVILNEDSNRGVGTQGKIDPGDTLTVRGTFERLDTQEIRKIEGRKKYRPLTNFERGFLKDTDVFLFSERISNLKNVE